MKKAAPHDQKAPKGSIGALGRRELEQKVFDALFDRFGLLVPIDAAHRHLGFPTRDSMLRAVRAGRLPLRVIRPEGRRESFVSSKDIAAYEATLAAPEDPAS